MQRVGNFNKGMFLKSAILLLVATSLLLLGMFSAFAEEEDTLALIRKYVQQSPPLTAYGKNVKAMVWHRSHTYKMLADGTLVKTSRWLIYSESPLPESWGKWIIPFVGDEGVELKEAAIYDPIDFKLIKTLSPITVDHRGLSWLEIDVPPMNIPHVFSLCYLKEFPGRWNVDDVVPIDLDLPQWRTIVSVSVPHDSSLVWATTKNNHMAPGLVQGVEDTYLWEFVNRFPASEFALEVENSNLLSFSMRNGWLNAIKPLEDWANSLKTVMHEDVKKILEKKDKSKSGLEILQWAKNKQLLLGSSSIWKIRRSAEEIPKEGPWTLWERNVLLAHWLSLAGWDVRINWLPLFVPNKNENVPGTPHMISRPIFEARSPGSGSYKFYDFGGSLREETGLMPDALWGKTVCLYDGMDVKLKQLDRGNIADHRLRARWNLELADTGEVQGTLELMLSGGWPYVIFGCQGYSLDMSSITHLYPPQVDVKWKEGEVLEKPNGLTIIYPVTGMLGITSGNQMLLMLPSISFDSLRALRGLDVGAKLRFPFLLEGFVTIKLPSGYEAFSLPYLSSKSDGKIRWEQSIDEKSRGRIVDARWRFLVEEFSLEEEALSTLHAGLKVLQQWSNRTVPIRRR